MASSLLMSLPARFAPAVLWLSFVPTSTPTASASLVGGGLMKCFGIYTPKRLLSPKISLSACSTMVRLFSSQTHHMLPLFRL